MYLARAVLDRQAPAQSDQSAGSCRGLDLVASCSQFYMKATSSALLIVDDHHELSAFVNAYPEARAIADHRLPFRYRDGGNYRTCLICG